MLKPIPQTVNRILPAKSSDFPSGLVLHYDMQDAGSIRITDRSGMGNHGTLTGVGGVPELRNAPNGYCRYFDGVDDCVLARTETEADSLLTSSFTLVVWAKGVMDLNNRMLISKSDSANASRWGLYFTTSNVINFTVSADGTLANSALISSSAEINSQKWIQVIGRFDIAKSGTNENISIWTNGKLATNTVTSVTSFFSNSTQSIFVGKRTEALLYKGLIGDVKIFNRALANTEIAELYKNEAGRYGIA